MTEKCECVEVENGKMPEIQHHLTDKIILDHLNNILKYSNLLVSIDYKELTKSDEPTAVSVTFNLLKKIDAI